MWLGAWTILLGFRDYASVSKMERELPCLRPEEADMLELTQQWARIAAAVKVRHASSWCPCAAKIQPSSAGVHGLPPLHLTCP
jgi:hypothetical protein